MKMHNELGEVAQGVDLRSFFNFNYDVKSASHSSIHITSQIFCKNRPFEGELFLNL